MLLAPYQKAWIEDPARFKTVNKSRRIGFSWCTALEIAMSAMAGEREYVVSASHTQANDLLAECVAHMRTLERVSGNQLISGKPAITQVKTTRGGLIRSMSAKPESMRGAGGNLTLDEFAWVPHSRKVWTAAKAITDPTLGRRDGYKLRVISTPAGDDQDNMFWRIWNAKEGSKFSKHKVTIFDAYAQGFPIDPEEKRSEEGDDMFEQEYNCSFLSASARYISAELLDRQLWEYEDQIPTGFHKLIYAGMDVARTRDNSAIEEGHLIQGTLWNVTGEARRKVPWDEQEAWADEVIGQAGFGRMAVDSTGLGNQFAERLVKAHGSRVEPVNFSGHNVKEHVITGLKLALERGKLRVRNDPDLRRDVLNLRRTQTVAGNVRYDAQRTSKGHSDRAIALALMVHASGGATVERTLRPDIRSSRRGRGKYGWA